MNNKNNNKKYLIFLLKIFATTNVFMIILWIFAFKDLLLGLPFPRIPFYSGIFVFSAIFIIDMVLANKISKTVTKEDL